MTCRKSKDNWRPWLHASVPCIDNSWSRQWSAVCCNLGQVGRQQTAVVVQWCGEPGSVMMLWWCWSAPLHHHHHVTKLLTVFSPLLSGDPPPTAAAAPLSCCRTLIYTTEQALDILPENFIHIKCNWDEMSLAKELSIERQLVQRGVVEDDGSWQAAWGYTHLGMWHNSDVTQCDNAMCDVW